MDQNTKTPMPEIKVEVNHGDGPTKNKRGLLASLFSGGGSAAGSASSGFGALIGGASGGGLLATKAGMIALVIVGSSVAGGIGLVGYKALNPSPDASGGGIQLFASRPANSKYDPTALPPASRDGTSSSLDSAAQAAARERAEREAEDAALEGEESAEASASADGAAAPGAQLAANGVSVNGGAGNPGTMTKALAGVKKFGEFSKGGSGGSAGVSAGGPGAPGMGVSGAAASYAGGKNGATSGFSKGGSRSSIYGGRGLARRGAGGNARRQLGAVMRDQRGTATSMGAGATYDGARAGNDIGGDPSVIGDGTGAPSEPKTLGANDATLNQNEVPEPPAKNMITPWQKAVQRAQMLVMIAIALAMAASKIPEGPQSKMIKMALGLAIIAMGGYIGMLAGKVMSGPNGQKLQGQAVAAAAAGVILTGIGVMAGSGKDCKGGNCGGAQGGSGAGAGAGGGAGGLLGAINPMILLGGGLAAVSMIGIMMMPKPKPIEVEKGQEGKYDITRLAEPRHADFV